MSMAFSIGDFFAVGQLAWTVYKSCKGAGGGFEEVSHEVIALHTAIKELQDEIENPDSILNRTGAGKKSELGLLVRNCLGVLQQLNKLLIKYKSLGTGSKKTWDRLRWGTENLSEIREKLIAHTSSLALFLTTLGTGSLGRIEKKLDELIADVRAGRREQTVLTMADGDEDDSDEQWKMWKNELVDDGFTKAELEGHKHWIKAKLRELIESGGLQEDSLPDENKSIGKQDSPLTTTTRPKTPEDAYMEKKQPKLQATVEDAEEVEDKRPETDARLLGNRKFTVDPNINPVMEATGMDNEAETGSSGEIDNASDETDDTFLPSDSISNIGVNTLAVENAASPSTSIRSPPSSSDTRGLQSRSSNDAAAIFSGPSQEELENTKIVSKERNPPRATEHRSPMPFRRAETQPADVGNSNLANQRDPVSVSQSNGGPRPARIRNPTEKDAEIRQNKQRKLPPDAEITVDDDGARHRRKSNRGKLVHEDPPFPVDVSESDPDSDSASSISSQEARRRRKQKSNIQPLPQSQTSSTKGMKPARMPDRARGGQLGGPSSYRESSNEKTRSYGSRYEQEPTFNPRSRSDQENFNAQGPSLPPEWQHRTYVPPQDRPESYLKVSEKPPALSQHLFGNGTGGFKFSSPDEIFAEFLRTQSGSPFDSSKEVPDPLASKDRGRIGVSSTRPVSVVERPLLLTLEELFRGCCKKLKVTSLAFDEVTGRGVEQEKILKINITPGLKKGSIIKSIGVGNQEEGGNQDIHFIVGEKAHALFSRHGDDIHHTIELDLVESLCGWERTVPTIDGIGIKIKKKRPTQPGSIEKFPYLGMLVSEESETRGLFVVTYKVKYPKVLTHVQKDMIRDALKNNS